jgi:uncharacterized protein YkwD
MPHLPRTLALLCLVALVAAPAAASRGRPAPNARFVAALNAQRVAHGLPRLRSDPRLAAAALAHSREMLIDGYYEHDSFDGTSFWQRIRSYYDARTVGENLLAVSPDVTAPRAVALWMSSRRHRENVLDPTFRAVGISAVHVPVAPRIFGGGPVTVVTADFASRSDG